MKSKLKKESLIKAWKSRVPKKESDFTEKICEILHDYGLRMSGQSNPISETIEKTKHIIAEAWQDPSSKLGETIVKCLRSIRSQHPDIWMNNTDALRNPKLDTMINVEAKQKTLMIKAESYLNRLYPHAKELILLRLWFELDFDKIDLVLDEQSGRTEKLYQQAVQHLASNLNQSDNMVTGILVKLPLHEKPVYTKNETQDISVLMDGYAKAQNRKKRNKFIGISLLVIAAIITAYYFLVK